MTKTIKTYTARCGATTITAQLQSWDGCEGQEKSLQEERADDWQRPGSAAAFTPPVIAGIFAALGCEIGNRWQFPMDAEKIRAQWKLD